MDGINISNQGSIGDFLKNASEVLGSAGDVTQWTFGGSVVLFGFTRRATLMLGI